MVNRGTNVEGEQIRKTVGLPLGKAGSGRERLGEAGLTLQARGDQVRILGVKFGSRAKRAGIEQGWKVARAQGCDRPALAHWIYVPGLALIALVWFVQRRRLRFASV
jgi:predicted metalloprotease with PDZ domain